MVSAEQVRRLIDSQSGGRSFRAAAAGAIADARANQQDTLALDIEALVAAQAPDNAAKHVNSLRAVPLGRDEVPLVSVRTPEVAFTDLVLTQGQVDLFEAIVREHRNLELLSSRGLSPRRRVLLTGPSGTGKTKTAEAFATELGQPLVTVRLAAVVSSYLGETARRLEQVMDFASSGSWVLAFDEIDMLGAERTADDHGEIRRVVTAFLQILEETNSRNLIVATTNHGRSLDKALWRRFDEVSAFRMPTQVQIEAILQIKLRRMRTKSNRREVARVMRGFTPAEVEAVCNDAMRNVTLSLRNTVTTEDLVTAAQSRKARLAEAGKFLS